MFDIIGDVFKEGFDAQTNSTNSTISTNNASSSINDITSNFSAYAQSGADNQELIGVINRITGIIMFIGIFISVTTIAIIGIRYMIGSVEERAEYKKTLLPWLIGAIMVFGITVIPTVIYKIAQAFN